MNSSLMSTGQILITEDTVRKVQEAKLPGGSQILIRTGSGETIPLETDIQRMLLQTLESVASSGEVTIGRIPEELTSTTAADLLGVSRPTLMKWVRQGEIDSFKVGSHTRFHRKEVLQLKARRAEERKTAFDELRSATAENDELFDD